MSPESTGGLSTALARLAPALPEMAVAAAVACLVTIVLTEPLIGWLSARQLGKAIRIDGPDHRAKAGTPTMGGLVMLAVCAAALLAQLVAGGAPGSDGGRLLTVVIALGVFGLLGMLDDLAGLARRRGDREIGIGLSARRMLGLQVLAAAGIAAWSWPGVHARAIASSGAPESFLSDPLMGLWSAGTPVAMAAWAVLVIAVLVGTVNGTNFSDGLDGLAAGLLAIAFASLGVVVVLIGAADRWAWIFLLSAAGACAGFLAHNRHPARVFMGNVASMGLGGALAATALVTGTWILLPVVGAVLVAEVVSDLIQIGYFKLSGGKRFFRMAPLHHHFEKGGMSEQTVVHRFWLAGALAGAAGLAAAIASIA